MRLFTKFRSFISHFLQNYSSRSDTPVEASDKQKQRKPVQPELFRIAFDDDIILSSCPSADWYRRLKYFPFACYNLSGAKYYDSLYDFNQKLRKKTLLKKKQKETKQRAKLRLLFDRETMQEDLPSASMIYTSEYKEPEQSTINPDDVRPGKTPNRRAGKKPKDFFPLLKSFIGAATMGYPPEPKEVHNLLKTNLPFLRVCGFVPKYTKDKYSFQHVPSLRKLEQFDQIMTEYGIWNDIKIQEINENLKSGYIKIEDKIVGDTTHYYAYSSFETVEYEDDKGRVKKKSQSKTTKKCNCKDKEKCDHDWVLVDDGAGTIVKSSSRMYWGHKASILGFPEQGIALDAVPVADSATHDGKTFYPHIKQLFSTYPVLSGSIKTLLYDSAADDASLKKRFKDELNIELKTSLNPRRKKDVTSDLPRGIRKITPFGNAICLEGRQMEYQGIRFEAEKYIYSAPLLENGEIACGSCKHKKECCPHAQKGRVVTIAFDLLPHIDSTDPPMAKRFKTMMKLRPSVERMIKTLKCDLADSRLSKTGNAAFQAYLDKTMIAYHQLLRMS